MTAALVLLGIYLLFFVPFLGHFLRHWLMHGLVHLFDHHPSAVPIFVATLWLLVVALVVLLSLRLWYPFSWVVLTIMILTQMFETFHKGHEE